jgi:hypothetical protein
MNNETQNNKTDKALGPHSIHVITLEAREAGGAAYNFILFRNALGEDAMALYGMPLKRGDDSMTLRAVMDVPQMPYVNLNHMDRVSEIEIFAGTGEEYLQKLVCATDAIEFINGQNLNYDTSNDNSPNSIAHTMVEAMGLEFPEHATRFWVPGHERVLLPTNWRSKHAS